MNKDFLEFVEAGGYDNTGLWTDEGTTNLLCTTLYSRLIYVIIIITTCINGMIRL